MGTETVVKRYLNPTQNLELIITDTCNFLIEATRSYITIGTVRYHRGSSIETHSKRWINLRFGTGWFG